MVFNNPVTAFLTECHLFLDYYITFILLCLCHILYRHVCLILRHKQLSVELDIVEAGLTLMSF